MGEVFEMAAAVVIEFIVEAFSDCVSSIKNRRLYGMDKLCQNQKAELGEKHIELPKKCGARVIK